MSQQKKHLVFSLEIYWEVLRLVLFPWHTAGGYGSCVYWGTRAFLAAVTKAALLETQPLAWRRGGAFLPFVLSARSENSQEIEILSKEEAEVRTTKAMGKCVRQVVP